MFGLVPFGARKDLARREDPFSQIFDVFNEPFFRNELAPFSSNWGAQSFRVDVKDNGDAYELTAELPGVKKEDIALRYENSYLTIEAKKDERKDEKDDSGNYIMRVYDAAGNMTEYTFTILMYFNASSLAFFALVLAVIIAVIVYVLRKRRRLKIG